MDSDEGSLPKKRPRRSKNQQDSDPVLRPSAHQMRLLWEYDNKCGHKYMNAPLRTCISTEPPDEPGVHRLSTDTMSLLMSDIKSMWKRLSLICEIFEDKDNPDLGYRLRIKNDIPIKVSMKHSDQILVGWKAAIPNGCASLHLYDRSDIDESYQYLGGPVSYSNWAPTKSANMVVKQISHGSSRHKVLAETKGTLLCGSELLWDYGKKNKPCFNNETWFNPRCCNIVPTTAKSCRSKEAVCEDLCVLCGKPYRLSSRNTVNRKAQKKVHLMNSHIDFLGSEWNGCGQFDIKKYPINCDAALLEAERMNRLLQTLHSNGWKVVPACTVLTRSEQAGSTDSVMNTFRKHCTRLKRIGCIVLRGRAVPETVEQLMPVKPCRWDLLFPDPAQKPPRVYAMKIADKQANEENLYNWSSQDVLMLTHVSHHDADSTSEEDDESD